MKTEINLYSKHNLTTCSICSSKGHDYNYCSQVKFKAYKSKIIYLSEVSFFQERNIKRIKRKKYKFKSILNQNVTLLCLNNYLLNNNLFDNVEDLIEKLEQINKNHITESNLKNKLDSTFSSTDSDKESKTN